VFSNGHSLADYQLVGDHPLWVDERGEHSDVEQVLRAACGELRGD
jgi:hypothetical protein